MIIEIDNHKIFEIKSCNQRKPCPKNVFHINSSNNHALTKAAKIKIKCSRRNGSQNDYTAIWNYKIKLFSYPISKYLIIFRSYITRSLFSFDWDRFHGVLQRGASNTTGSLFSYRMHVVKRHPTTSRLNSPIYYVWKRYSSGSEFVSMMRPLANDI